MDIYIVCCNDTVLIIVVCGYENVPTLYFNVQLIFRDVVDIFL